MTNLLYVVFGGAIGCVLRYLFLQMFAGAQFSKLPSYINYVLAVNILGSFFIGIFYSFLQKDFIAAEYKDFLKFFVIVGFLGGFTTFSSLSLDLLLFFEKGEYISALIYIAISVFLGLLAAYAGYSLVK